MSHNIKNPAAIGIDLAKSIMHLHALDKQGNKLWKQTLKIGRCRAAAVPLPCHNRATANCFRAAAELLPCRCRAAAVMLPLLYRANFRAAAVLLYSRSHPAAVPQR